MRGIVGHVQYGYMQMNSSNRKHSLKTALENVFNKMFVYK